MITTKSASVLCPRSSVCEELIGGNRPQGLHTCWKQNIRVFSRVPPEPSEGHRHPFEAILEDYSVADPVLQKFALIVRAADVKGQESAAPEGIGLRSIAQGFAALGISDEERLFRQFPIYDALYAYVQGRG